MPGKAISRFYDGVPRLSDFAEAIDTSIYKELPADQPGLLFDASAQENRHGSSRSPGLQASKSPSLRDSVKSWCNDRRVVASQQAVRHSSAE